ncbi:hypothetical protein [Serratia proteamaculans]|uniref:hypothetical protein n=1 Tax=Serratia proteamaculans TaxID=28151 RepID=UPI003CFE63AB
MEKFLAVIGVLVAVLSVSACKEESNAGLIGNWVEQSRSSALQHPRLLSISDDNGTFLVDEKIYLDGEYKTQREVGQPTSKSTISVKNGLRNIRLENGVIFYRNITFIKTP